MKEEHFLLIFKQTAKEIPIITLVISKIIRWSLCKAMLKTILLKSFISKWSKYASFKFLARFLMNQ